MEPWLIALIITIVGSSCGIGLCVFISNNIVGTMRIDLMKQFNDVIERVSDKFEQERHTINSSFNTLAASNNQVTLRFEEKLSEINTVLKKLEVDIAGTDILKEWFLRHEEGNIKAFDRVREQIDKRIL